MTPWTIMVAATLALHRAAAQDASTTFVPCGATRTASNAPVPFCALTTRPAFDTLGPLPQLPEILALGVAGGSVRISATLDTAARLERSGARIVPLAHVAPPYHPLVHSAVMRALSTFRFSPGMVGGHKVPVQLDIEVHEPLPADRGEPRHFVIRRAEQTWGIDLTVGYEPMVRESPVPHLAPAEVANVWRAVVSALTPVRPQDSTRVHCVAYDSGIGFRDPAPSVFASGSAVRVVPYSVCPPTYGAMAARSDSVGNRIVAPPGQLDPVRLFIDQTVPYTTNAVAVWLTGSTGTGRFYVTCSVTRERSPVWTADCHIAKSTIS